MFSGDAKDEIARVRFERSCCPASFLRVLARYSSRTPSSTIVTTQRGSIARAALAAAKSAGVTAFADSRHTKRFGARVVYVVRADEPMRPLVRPPDRNCCRRAWLRGAFLACGSVSDPARGYHLEFCCRDDAAVRSLCEGLAAFGVDAAISRRRGRTLAYVKGAEAVADVLGHMGASQAVLALDNVRVLRQTKNDIRRIVNSEAANAARAATSSARQREAAMRAIKRYGLGKLGNALGQAAQLRIAHPDLTLSELALRARPRVTKSTMSYRLRLIEQLARRGRATPRMQKKR